MLDFFDIPPEVFKSLKGIANDTSSDKNVDLAGNIEKEYDLTKYIPLIEPTLMNIIKDPKTNSSNHLKTVKVTKHLKLKHAFIHSFHSFISFSIVHGYLC